jgi:hypothetical protein
MTMKIVFFIESLPMELSRFTGFGSCWRAPLPVRVRRGQAWFLATHGTNSI